jgi:hypothetical protein
MSKRDPEIALRQILSHARETVEIAYGKTRSEMDADRLLTEIKPIEGDMDAIKAELVHMAESIP